MGSLSIELHHIAKYSLACLGRYGKTQNWLAANYTQQEQNHAELRVCRVMFEPNDVIHLTAVDESTLTTT